MPEPPRPGRRSSAGRPNNPAARRRSTRTRRNHRRAPAGDTAQEGPVPPARSGIRWSPAPERLRYRSRRHGPTTRQEHRPLASEKFPAPDPSEPVSLLARCPSHCPRCAYHAMHQHVRICHESIIEIIVTSHLSRGTIKELGQRSAMIAGPPEGVPRVGANLFSSRCERPPFLPSIRPRLCDATKSTSSDSGVAPDAIAVPPAVATTIGGTLEDPSTLGTKKHGLTS